MAHEHMVKLLNTQWGITVDLTGDDGSMKEIQLSGTSSGSILTSVTADDLKNDLREIVVITPDANQILKVKVSGYTSKETKFETKRMVASDTNKIYNEDIRGVIFEEKAQVELYDLGTDGDYIIKLRYV